MEIEKNDPKYEKMLSFIERLLSNKNFENQSVVEREDNVLKFFVQNESQLKPTFLSDAYFPDMEWKVIKALFFTVLRDYVIEKLLPEIDFVSDNINFSVVRAVAEGPLEDYKSSVINFYKKIITHKDVRKEFLGVFKTVKFNLLAKYLEAFRLRKGYGTLELFKDKELQGIDDYTHFLKICLILRNILWIKVPVKDERGKMSTMTYDEAKEAPLVKREFFKKINGIVKSQFGTLPELFIKTSMNSVIDPSDTTSDVDGLSMFLKIIAERAKDANSGIKVDKGAESPDKSWFNIARRNSAYYGFDTRLLEEFYFIASEHNW